MTKLPFESRNVIPRLDLPEYELPGVCQAPGCNSTRGLENHHVWRRSFGAGFAEAWWVELPSGAVVPQRVHLCPLCHLPITENKAAIEVFEDEGNDVWLFWVEGNPQDPDENIRTLLDPQPQGGASGRTPVSTEAEGRSAMQLTVEGEEVPHEEVCEEQHGEEPCAKCKGTGRVKRRPKRKATSGTGKTQVIAIRIPATEARGFENLSALHDAAEAILVEQGILKERANGSAYYRDMAIYAQFVQEHRELLPADWKKGDFDLEERESA